MHGAGGSAKRMLMGQFAKMAASNNVVMISPQAENAWDG